MTGQLYSDEEMGILPSQGGGAQNNSSADPSGGDFLSQLTAANQQDAAAARANVSPAANGDFSSRLDAAFGEPPRNKPDFSKFDQVFGGDGQRLLTDEEVGLGPKPAPTAATFGLPHQFDPS